MRELAGWTVVEDAGASASGSKPQEKLGSRYNETFNLLVEWGVWSRGGMGLHYRSSLGVIQDMQLGASSRDAQITDEMAGRIDRVVSRLQPRNPDLHKVLVLTFCAGMSQREVARSMKISGQGAARDLLNRAIPLVDMLLFEMAA